MADARAHSRFGASAAERWTVCTAAPLYCERVPPMPDTLESMEGTAAHELIRMCLLNGFNVDELVGRTVTIDILGPGGKRYRRGFEVSPEMGEAVEPFVARGRGYMAQGAKIFVEHRFSLAEFDAELWGTCDLAAYFPDTRTLVVDDFKYGEAVFVSVVQNKQAMTYGAGALFALSEYPIEKIVLGIDQPRCSTSGETYRTWETSPGELFEHAGDLAATIDVARGPDAKFVPGPHCQFCPGRGTCDALHTAALAAAGADLEPHSQSFLPPPEPEMMSLDELGRRLAQADIIRTWLNGLHAWSVAEMMRGRIATGFKAVEKVGRRAWVDGELAMDQARRAFPDLSDDELYARKPVSPAQFEKLVGKANAKDFVASYVTKPKGLTLAKLSDKRPAVSLETLSEFEPIGDEDDAD